MSQPRSTVEEFPREVLVSSVHGVIVAGPDGRIVFANTVVRELTGYDRGGLDERPVTDVCRVPGRDLSTRIGRLLDERERTERYHDVTLVGRDGSERPVTVSIEAAGTDWENHVVLRVYRRPSSGESTSDALPRHPLDTPVERTQAALVREHLDAIGRVFDTDVACLRSVNESSSDLAPVAETERATQLCDSYPGFDLGATHAGRAFRRGEPVVDSPAGGDGGPLDRPSVHVPLGDWGTMSVFLSGDGSVGETTVDTAETVGSLLSSSLSRLDRDRTSTGSHPSTASREPTGSSRPSLAAIRNAFDQLLRAGSANDVKKRLCDGLAVGGVFEPARVVEVSSDGQLVVTGGSTAESDGHPEFVDVSGTVEQAVREVADAPGSTTTVRVGEGASATESVDPSGSDEHVVVVASVGHNGRTFGALVARCGAAGTFDGLVEEYISTLSDFAGLTLFAHNNRELVLSERRTELEFEVTGSSCLAVPVSAALDCYCEVEHNTLTSDDDHLLYLRVDHPKAADVIDAAATVDSVTSCRPVWEDDEECVVEVIKTESGAETMIGFGAAVSEASAERGTGTLVIQLPQSVDTGAVVDAYIDRNPDARLVSKRTVDRAVETAQSVDDGALEHLTEKQRSALFTAFHAGYFNWPRGSTAEEVASSLGVTSPTFQQHLRVALEQLVASHANNSPDPGLSLTEER
jgi:PAS domain S-box-containing protein